MEAIKAITPTSGVDLAVVKYDFDFWSSLFVQWINTIGDKTSLVKLATTGCELAMVLGGVVPYVPQYLQIKKTQSTQGFSLYVCLALLMANTLRILFWFGVQYETPLLVQSILMNLAMFSLVQLCTTINNRPDYLVPGEKRKKQHTFTDFEPDFFWQWTDFSSYVEFIMCVAALGSVLMYFFVGYSPFVETVGFLAVFTESMLGMPQFYRNFKNKSTYGMALSMVLMWTCGDVFKTSYFYLRKTPPQFFICGALQVTVDLMILGQVWLYRENTDKRKRSERNMSL